MTNHPEAVAIIQEEMRRGLRYDSRLTPAEIMGRVRKRLLAEQKPIKAAKDLVGINMRIDCTCGFATGITIGLMGKQCYPWCKGHDEIQFINKPEIQPYKDISTNVWLTVRSPWSEL